MAKYETITKSNFTQAELAKLIDHSLLFAYTTTDEILAFLKDIKEYKFGCACVNSIYTEMAAKELKGYDVLLATTIGYPWGTLPYELKVNEAEYVIKKGAGTIDYVISIGAAKGHDWDYLKKEMDAIKAVAVKYGVTCKAIIECCYLTDEEKVKSALIAKNAGFDFVKTSTGFGSGWCTVPDVKLLKETVGADMGVKASGKITDFKTALELLQAGASRLGTRAGVDILKSM
ncbi:MAG: deoxyribose-phosphate aldolase [Christensenellales bacterium]